MVWTENRKRYTVQACTEDILTVKNGTLTVPLSVLKIEIKATFLRGTHTVRPLNQSYLRHCVIISATSCASKMSYSHSEILEIVLPIISGSRQSCSARKCQ